MSDERYKANLSLLAKHFPQLYQSIQRFASPSTTMEPVIQDCKKQGYTMQVRSHIGRRLLHNQYDALQEAKRWAGENQPSQAAVAVIMGWGLGYFALEWIKQHADQCNAILIWEPEPQLFIESLPYADLTLLSKPKNIQVILGCQEGLLYQNLHQYLSYLLNSELKIVAAPFVDVYGKQTVQFLKQDVSQIISTKKNALNYMETMGKHCQLNLIENLSHLPNCWLPHDIEGIAKRQPGIIVAAGPSLDKNIDQLQSLQNKAWIFAFDTSLPTLLKRGIKPDFVVSKDPTDLNTKHFETIKTLFNDISFLPLLAFDPIIPASTTKFFSETKIWLPGRNNQIYRFLDQHKLKPVDRLPYSTNVSIAAFNLAHVMGCEPIIFVGLDLCFSDASGHSHAQDTALRSTTMFDQNTNQISYVRGRSQDKVYGIKVEGIDGKQYPTIENFYEALRLLEQLIHQASVHCIDASEGGAKIAGTEIMSLQETINQFCNATIQKTLPDNSSFDKTNFRQNLLKIISYIEECQTIAQDALNQLKDSACYDCINLAEFELKRGWLEQDNKLYSLLEPALERLLVEIDRPGFFKDDHPEDELIKRYAWYFSEIEKTCHQFIPIFKKTADSI